MLMEGWLERVIIRPMEEKDLPELEWDGAYTHFRRVYTEAFRRMLRGLALIWVAEYPGAGVIAQVFIQLICERNELADGKQRAYLYSFRVQPAFRSGGLGTRMVNFVEDDLRARGFEYLTLNVAKDNSRAIELYERLGYLIEAHEPGRWSYIDHLGVRQYVEEPAWRMKKHL